MHKTQTPKAAVRDRSYYRMLTAVELIHQVNQGAAGPEICHVLCERLEELLEEGDA
jgi:hypothetical protein